LIPEVLAVNRYHIQLSIKREMVKRSEQGPDTFIQVPWKPFIPSPAAGQCRDTFIKF